MKIYSYLIPSLAVFIGLLTLNGVYNQNYGFQIINGLLIALSVSFFLIPAYLKINRVMFLWYLLYFFYIISIGLFFHNNNYYHSLAYLSLIFLFIIALPSLNRSLSVNITVQVFILRAITVITLIFIFLNVETYIGKGMYLEKIAYESVMSNPNLTGYLFYLGFSISWMLFDHKKQNTSAALMVFFFLCSIILLPVLTVYMAIFSYIIIIKYLKGSPVYKKINNWMALLIFILSYNFIFNDFEQWRFILSQRDFLYIKGFELAQDKIWFGYGINNWGYLHHQITNPHNFLLYIVLSFGIIGLAIYLAHFIILLKVGLKKMKTYPHESYFKHMYTQLLVNTLIMLSFVSLPGHYQGSSLVLSLIYSIVVNGIIYVGNNTLSQKKSNGLQE
jgi:hypothetical protein